MRIMRFAHLAAAAGVALLFALRPAVAAEKLVLAHFLDVGSANHKQALWAADEIARQSNGRYAIEVVGGGTLGNSDAKMDEALKVGIADLIFQGAATAAAHYPPLAIASAPLNFRDYAHWKAFRDSGAYGDIRSGYEQASGNSVLGLMYYGQRHMTTKVPLNTIADLKGMKVRVPPAPVNLLLFRTLGAVPVSVPFGDVYDALKQGMVDAEENPLPTILGMKFYEVAPIITLTGHLTDTQMILAGSDKWKALPAADRQLIAAVFAQAAARASDDVDAQEHEAIAQLKAAGATIATFDHAALAQALQPVITSDAPWAGALYQKVQALH